MLKFKILISDNHSIVRHGLGMFINDLFRSVSIYQASSCEDTLKVLRDCRVDLLVLDINFPVGNSLNFISEIINIQTDIKILMFSAHDEEIYALRYLNAGAAGYLHKGCSEEEIKEAFLSMINVGKYITPKIKEKILDSYMLKTPINPLDRLSNRELDVARLLIKGCGNLEISNYLNIKKTTVSTFKNRIYEKLNIGNLAALIDFFHLYSDNKGSKAI